MCKGPVRGRVLAEGMKHGEQGEGVQDGAGEVAWRGKCGWERRLQVSLSRVNSITEARCQSKSFNKSTLVFNFCTKIA